MDEHKEKIKTTIGDKEGNLWAWRGINPYRQHPLKLLELAYKEPVTLSQINGQYRRLQKRLDQGHQHEPEAGVSLSALGRARELLMTPETRVLCELMRMPPVKVSSDDVAALAKLAEELFEKPRTLPEPLPLRLAWESFLDVVLEFLAAQTDDDGAPDLGPVPAMGPAPAFRRLHSAGVSFRIRKKQPLNHGAY